MAEFLELYSEAGMIGVVGAMFVFMVYQNAKRSEQQANAIEALKIENEGQSKNIENIEGIVLKFFLTTTTVFPNCLASEKINRQLLLAFQIGFSL